MATVSFANILPSTGMLNIIVFIGALVASCVVIGAIIIFALVKMKQVKVIEIDLESHKMKFSTGRIKKTKKGTKQFWYRAARKYLPQVSGADLFTKGKKDVLVLFKDKNGLYHPARSPTYENIVDYYQAAYELDLEDKDAVAAHSQKDRIMKLKNVFLLPNPHEDIDWLINQVIEANVEFMDKEWWKHPNIMVLGTAFICFMMIVMTLVLGGKLTG